jgi:polyisoprenoid-binding protein YceI
VPELTRRRLVLGGGAAALLAVALIVIAVWYFVLRGDAPPPVALEQAVAVAATPEAESAADAVPAEQAAGVEPQAEAEVEEPPAEDGSPADQAADAETEAAPEAAEPAAAEEEVAEEAVEEAPTPDGGLVGRWQVLADGSSFAGYRVEEELARIGAVTAVGRSTVLTGSLVFDGAAITEVVIEVDLTALTSDDSRRDGALRRQALETNTYPTTTFTLTQPIPIDALPAEGEALAVTATGDLTLHGVTREVQIPMEGQLVGDRVAVVGSLEIVFADYDMDTPSAFIVLAIDDHGIMEFQLVFERS